MSVPVRKSLGDAFRPEALSGYSCSGFRPWLFDREDECDRPVRAIQRGASNVHFGVVCSALSIPPASEAVGLIVQEVRSVLDAVPEPTLPSVLEGLAQQYGVTSEQLLSAYRTFAHDRNRDANGPDGASGPHGGVHMLFPRTGKILS